MSMIDGFVPTKTFNWYQMPNHSYFVPPKTFSRDKTQFENHYVPPKTFNRYHLPKETNSVPLKTFNWHQMPNHTYFVPHKTVSRDKIRTNCHPHLPTHQDNHTGNRHPSTTTPLTPATRPCTPIRQTKRQRNGSTDMDTVPHKIGIRRIIRVDSPPQTVRKVLARPKYPVPLYKAKSGFSILTEECLTFRTTSPVYP